MTARYATCQCHIAGTSKLELRAKRRAKNSGGSAKNVDQSKQGRHKNVAGAATVAGTSDCHSDRATSDPARALYMAQWVIGWHESAFDNHASLQRTSASARCHDSRLPAFKSNAPFIAKIIFLAPIAASCACQIG